MRSINSSLATGGRLLRESLMPLAPPTPRTHSSGSHAPSSPAGGGRGSRGSGGGGGDGVTFFTNDLAAPPNVSSWERSLEIRNATQRLSNLARPSPRSRVLQGWLMEVRVTVFGTEFETKVYVVFNRFVREITASNAAADVRTLANCTCDIMPDSETDFVVRGNMVQMGDDDVTEEGTQASLNLRASDVAERDHWVSWIEASTTARGKGESNAEVMLAESLHHSEKFVEASDLTGVTTTTTTEPLASPSSESATRHILILPKSSGLRTISPIPAAANNANNTTSSSSSVKFAPTTTTTTTTTTSSDTSTLLQPPIPPINILPPPQQQPETTINNAPRLGNRAMSSGSARRKRTSKTATDPLDEDDMALLFAQPESGLPHTAVRFLFPIMRSNVCVVLLAYGTNNEESNKEIVNTITAMRPNSVVVESDFLSIDAIEEETVRMAGKNKPATMGRRKNSFEFWGKRNSNSDNGKTDAAGVDSTTTPATTLHINETRKSSTTTDTAPPQQQRTSRQFTSSSSNFRFFASTFSSGGFSTNTTSSSSTSPFHRAARAGVDPGLIAQSIAIRAGRKTGAQVVFASDANKNVVPSINAQPPPTRTPTSPERFSVATSFFNFPGGIRGASNHAQTANDQSMWKVHLSPEQIRTMLNLPLYFRQGEDKHRDLASLLDQMRSGHGVDENDLLHKVRHEGLPLLPLTHLIYLNELFSKKHFGLTSAILESRAQVLADAILWSASGRIRLACIPLHLFWSVVQRLEEYVETSTAQNPLTLRGAQRLMSRGLETLRLDEVQTALTYLSSQSANDAEVRHAVARELYKDMLRVLAMWIGDHSTSGVNDCFLHVFECLADVASDPILHRCLLDVKVVLSVSSVSLGQLDNVHLLIEGLFILREIATRGDAGDQTTPTSPGSSSGGSMLGFKGFRATRWGGGKRGGTPTTVGAATKGSIQDSLDMCHLVVLAAMRHHEDNIKIIHAACSTLLALTRHAVLRQRLLEDGALPMLLNILDKCLDVFSVAPDLAVPASPGTGIEMSRKLQKSTVLDAMDAVGCLVTVSSSVLGDLSEANRLVLRALLGIVARAEKNDEPRERSDVFEIDLAIVSLSAAYSLSKPTKNVTNLVELGLHSCVFDVARIFPYVWQIQMNASMVLSSLLLVEPTEVSEVLKDNGAIQVFEAVIARFDSNERVVARAMTLVRSLQQDV